MNHEKGEIMKARTTLNSLLAATACAALLASAGYAQNRQRNQGDRDQSQNYQQNEQQQRQQYQDQDRNRQSSDQRSQDQREQNQRARSQGQGQGQVSSSGTDIWNLQPAGWVTIGYDLDRDGTFDAFEHIHSFDLQRSNSGQSGSAAYRPGSRGSNSAFQGVPSRQKVRRYEGTVQSVMTKNLARMDEPHTLITLRNQQGKTVKADLGPESKLKGVNLQKGERVTVFGTKGTINDKPVLMAEQITFNGERHRIHLPKDQGLKRIRGEIKSTHSTQFRGVDQGHLIARVQLDSGRTVPVNLGPESDFQDLDLQRGDEISALVSQGRMNGQRAFIAEQVSFQGKMIEVNRPERDRALKEKENRRRGKDTQQAQGGLGKS
jgi:hypothetical protein